YRWCNIPTRTSCKISRRFGCLRRSGARGRRKMDRQAAPRQLILAKTPPLIALAQRNLFDILRVLYERIVVPSAVYREAVTEGQGRAGSREVEAAIAAGWIEVMALYEPEAAQGLRTQFLLGDGESMESSNTYAWLMITS